MITYRNLKTPCSKGCGQPAFARGLCSAHYASHRYKMRALGQWRPRVDATGTARRLQALVALGYSVNHIGELLDRTPVWVSQLLNHHRVKVNGDTAHNIAELYDRLSMTPGPSQQARNRAIRKGWMPPLAWDEGSIDDPLGVPHPGHQERIGFTERFTEMRELGYTDLEILSRWKMRPNALLRQLHRYDIIPQPELVSVAQEARSKSEVRSKAAS